MDIADCRDCQDASIRNAVLNIVAPDAADLIACPADGGGRGGVGVEGWGGGANIVVSKSISYEILSSDEDDIFDLTASAPSPQASRSTRGCGGDGGGGGGGGGGECWKEHVAHVEASAGLLKVLLPSESDKQELARCEWLCIKEWSGSREVLALWMTVRCCCKKGPGAGDEHRESLPVRLTCVKGSRAVELLLQTATDLDAKSSSSSASRRNLDCS